MLCAAFREPLCVVVKFVAYIDEFDDTGLEDVKRPNRTKGASEWLVLSCFLIRESDDLKCPGWVQEILSQFKSNRDHLHFSELWDWKKEIACRNVTTKPCRYFIVASNKKNIEGWEYAYRVASKGVFVSASSHGAGTQPCLD